MELTELEVAKIRTAMSRIPGSAVTSYFQRAHNNAITADVIVTFLGEVGKAMDQLIYERNVASRELAELQAGFSA